MTLILLFPSFLPSFSHSFVFYYCRFSPLPYHPSSKESLILSLIPVVVIIRGAAGGLGDHHRSAGVARVAQTAPPPLLLLVPRRAPI